MEYSSFEESLKLAARKYFFGKYGQKIIEGKAIDSDLGFRPTFYFKRTDHVYCAVEVGPTPYPQILRIKRGDLMDTPIAISVYSVIPEDIFLAKESQREINELREAGFGLIKVDSTGVAAEAFPCIPIVQRISKAEFLDDISGLPVGHRRAMMLCYESYCNDPAAGLRDIGDLIEGLIMRAGKDAAGKNFITKAAARTKIAQLVPTLQGVSQLSNANTALGSALAYYSTWRNQVAHAPKNATQKYKRYKDCRHGFKEGVRTAIYLNKALKDVHLSGKLA